jgi:hypothetical protein
VKTRETASPGYKEALAGHQAVVSPGLIDPSIADAVERQTRAMRQLSRRAFRESETPSDDQPAPIEAARRQRRRGSEATRALALRRAWAERAARQAPHVRRCCRASPAAYDGVSTSIVCEANTGDRTMSWDERRGLRAR